MTFQQQRCRATVLAVIQECSTEVIERFNNCNLGVEADEARVVRERETATREHLTFTESEELQ